MNSLLPVIALIINRSLSAGVVPDCMKVAHVSPLLKKPSLDPNELKNYRPVSNLSFLSKVLEKVVAQQLNLHLANNNLHEPMQSAYKTQHSTETALVRVMNDVLQAADQQQLTLLVLLDLSAAFDTIDHELLLERMHIRLNISVTALDWFRSYLSQRSQIIAAGSEKSEPYKLQYGVPQGSVLGPLLFGIYMLPLGDLLRSYGLCFHQYADDTQLYISTKPENNNIQQSVVQLERGLEQVKLWMKNNKLKLNGDRTEFIVMGSINQLSKCTIPPLHIDGSIVPPSKSVRNLGVVFDQELNLTDHVSSLCKSLNFHLQNISMIRSFLLWKQPKTSHSSSYNISLGLLQLFTSWPTENPAGQITTSPE